jgi:putative redox protein
MDPIVSTFPAVTANIGEIAYTVTLMDGVHHWLGDESELDGGANAGPTPSHLLLSSLGACTAITLSMYAKRKAWPLTSTLSLIRKVNLMRGIKLCVMSYCMVS